MWILYAIFGAFSQAIEIAITKRNLRTKDLNNFMASFGFILSGFILGILLLIKTGTIWPEIGNNFYFWNGILWAVLLNVIGIYFSFKALSVADLSYFTSWFILSSIFVVVPPIFLFGEIPSTLSFFGILIIVAGAFLMDGKKRSSMTRKELVNRKNNFKGRMYLIAVLVPYAVTPSVTKMAILESSALFVSFLLSLFIGLSFMAFIFLSREHGGIANILDDMDVRARRSFFLMIIGASMFGMLSYTSINFALNISEVAHVMAIKRIMPIFAFSIGYFIFKEKFGVKRKIIATLLIVTGVILVTLFK